MQWINEKSRYSWGGSNRQVISEQRTEAHVIRPNDQKQADQPGLAETIRLRRRFLRELAKATTQEVGP